MFADVSMLFQRRRFLVKERVGLLKLTDTYDIFDPDTWFTSTRPSPPRP